MRWVSVSLRVRLRFCELLSERMWGWDFVSVWVSVSVGVRLYEFVFGREREGEILWFGWLILDGSENEVRVTSWVCEWDRMSEVRQSALMKTNDSMFWSCCNFISAFNLRSHKQCTTRQVCSAAATAEARNLSPRSPCGTCVGTQLVHNDRVHFGVVSQSPYLSGPVPRDLVSRHFQMQSWVQATKCAYITPPHPPYILWSRCHIKSCFIQTLCWAHLWPWLKGRQFKYQSVHVFARSKVLIPRWENFAECVSNQFLSSFRLLTRHAALICEHSKSDTSSFEMSPFQQTQVSLSKSSPIFQTSCPSRNTLREVCFVLASFDLNLFLTSRLRWHIFKNNAIISMAVYKADLHIK
jgi:hypothetical protein